MNTGGCCQEGYASTVLLLLQSTMLCYFRRETCYCTAGGRCSAFAVQVQLSCAGPQPNHLLLCDSFWVEPCLTAQGFVSLHVEIMVM
jgi:hypothetical protein